jgi:hypothetical protein
LGYKQATGLNYAQNSIHYGILFVCLVAVAARSPVAARKHRIDPRAYAPGEVIVKLKNDAPAISSADRGERFARVQTSQANTIN